MHCFSFFHDSLHLKYFATQKRLKNCILQMVGFTWIHLFNPLRYPGLKQRSKKHDVSKGREVRKNKLQMSDVLQNAFLQKCISLFLLTYLKFLGALAVAVAIFPIIVRVILVAS